MESSTIQSGIKKKNIRCDGRTLNEILFQVFGFLMKVQGIAPEGLSPAIKKKKKLQPEIGYVGSIVHR